MAGRLALALDMPDPAIERKQAIVVVNPASRNRRNHWIQGPLHEDPERWLEAAESRPGSWWLHWSTWLAQHGGIKVPARTRLGGERGTEIEPAPGRYVKENPDRTAR